MFEIGSTVLYGSEGVCKVSDITHKDFGRGEGEYYVLEPIYQKKSTVFVPLDNERLLGKMRCVLSSDELFEVIDQSEKQPLNWIADEAERKLQYKEIISRGDCGELLQLVKTLYQHRIEQEEQGKKLHASDDRFLKTAERMLNDEFAIVLRIDPEDVPNFISDRLGNERPRASRRSLLR